MTAAKPAQRPTVPHFSSGPCAKRPGWNAQNLKDAALGRSHRAKIGKAKLKQAIDLTREVLEVPAEYRVLLVGDAFDQVAIVAHDEQRAGEHDGHFLARMRVTRDGYAGRHFEDGDNDFLVSAGEIRRFQHEAVGFGGLRKG